MFHLLKRDMMLTKGFMLFTLIAIPFAYVTNFPPIITILYLATVIFTGLFVLDKRNHVNRSIISMPVSKGELIFSRYTFFIGIWILLVIYQYLWSKGIYHYNVTFFHGAFELTWKDAIVTICICSILTALFIPIMYAIRSFYAATAIIWIIGFGLLFLSIDPLVNILGREDEDMIIFNDLDQGFVLLVENYLPFQSFVTLGLGTALLLGLSFLLSKQIIHKRDF